MNSGAALRIARAITPRSARERRFEEWQADVAGCEEAGIPSAGIALGALRQAAEARGRLLLVTVIEALAHGRAVGIGVLLAAACAAGGIPVLAVVALAVLLQCGVLAIARRRARVRRPRPHRVGVRG